MKAQVPNLVKKTLHHINQANFQAYIVGGSVRDILTAKDVNDWDFTTDATPQEIQALFPESFYDNKFGTVGVTVEELMKQFELNDYDFEADGLELSDVFEITTFRTEGSYSDNRRPDSVSWGKTLEEDLKRRDLTVNAMAMKLSSTEGEFDLIDLYGGESDLNNRVLKAVGDAHERFNEDALRMMRTVRLAAQLGFIIEGKTFTALLENASLLKNISQERIRDEVLKLVVTEYAVDGMKVLLSTGLLHYVLPEMQYCVGVLQAGHHTKDVWNHSIDAMQACPSKDPVVKLAALLHDVGKPISYRKIDGKVTFYGHEVVGERLVRKIAQRLHLSNKDSEKLAMLVRYHMFVYDSDMTDAAIRRFIKNVGVENINDMIMLRIGDRVGGGAKETSWRLEEFQERIKAVLITPMQVKDLKISGFDVMEVLQVKGGPIVGKVLNTLFEEVMEDSEKNDRDYLLGRIKEVAYEESTPPQDGAPQEGN